MRISDWSSDVCSSQPGIYGLDTSDRNNWCYRHYWRGRAWLVFATTKDRIAQSTITCQPRRGRVKSLCAPVSWVPKQLSFHKCTPKIAGRIQRERSERVGHGGKGRIR